uniref:Uncharacterized protein n=1 Tax=Sphaerodactylus townsendi TaxID=933632 RepID=A0ACB8FY23_9SAUR
MSTLPFATALPGQETGKHPQKASRQHGRRSLLRCRTAFWGASLFPDRERHRKRQELIINYEINFTVYYKMIKEGLGSDVEMSMMPFPPLCSLPLLQAVAGVGKLQKIVHLSG